MNLHQLIYQSRALVPFECPELRALLQQARGFNQARGITGLLLLTPDGRFLQVLEGERAAVRDLYYHHIALDPRHFDCHVISEAEGAERLFEGWHMAFRPAQAVTLRTLLAPVPPPTAAALLLPHPRTHAELLELLLDFAARNAPVPELEDTCR